MPPPEGAAPARHTPSVHRRRLPLLGRSGLLGWNKTGTGHYRMFNTAQMVTLANLTALVAAGMPPTRAIKHIGRDRIVAGDCTIQVDLTGINRRMARAVARVS